MVVAMPMSVKMKILKRDSSNPYQLVSVVLASALVSCFLGAPSAVEGAFAYPPSPWSVNRTTSGSLWRGGNVRKSGINSVEGSLNNNINCNSDRLAVYKVVLHTYWTRDLFPKHYPDWRPPAQWSNTIG